MMASSLPTRLQKAEFWAIQAAVLMAPFPAIRHSTIFFTVSDYLFLIAIILRLGCKIPIAPLGALTGVWFAGLVALTGGLMASSLVSGDPLRGLIVDAQYVFAFMILPFALLGRTNDQAWRLVKCFVVAMAVMSAIGIAFYASGYNGGTARRLAIVTGGNRLSGFVDNANGMAGYIVLTLPLLWLLWQQRSLSSKYALIILIILITALILTSSNTGLIGLAVVTIILLGGRRNLFALSFVGVLATVIATWGQPYLPQVFKDRVLNAILNEDITQAGTYQGRHDLAVEAMRWTEDHLFLGVGADQYRLLSEYNLPVHNTYLLLWVEGGLVAMLGFVILLLCIIAAPLTQRGGSPAGSVALAAFATTVVFAGMGMGYTHVYARSLILPMLLAISPAVAAIPQFRNRRRNSSANAEMRNKMSAAALGVPAQRLNHSTEG
ncbi:O-antigen ligase family protein (plasmid) [Sphingobium sp. V4]|uniref:O-antigen ligase family protein n=1 Tax=Sphingobium sp. V4 TaxID=3038927 RepID=UPI002557D77A|nr:O-antigen ligase family protein [Sphingobium sp. V4]WIW90729.1 O-antigen ligase family protein [Sphingobium sp. V4]